MAGPKVVGGRPDPAAAGGEFTKAFANVLDAIQAGKQAELLKLQIETGARQQAATRMTNFIDSMLKLEMQRNPGGPAGAIRQYSKFLGKVAGMNGLDPTVSENMWNDIAADMEKNPTLRETIASDVANYIVGAPPEQQALHQEYMRRKQATTGARGEYDPAAGPMPGVEATAPEEEAAAPVVAEPVGVEGAPQEDPWIRMMMGPVTPAKTALVKTRYDEATKALETQDTNDPMSVKRTTAALRRSHEAAEAGSTKATKRRSLDDPEVQARYKNLFGDNWAKIISFAAMGDEALSRYLQVEAGKNINLTMNEKEKAEADLIRQKVDHWKETGEPVETTEALALARIEGQLRRDLSADQDERARQAMEASQKRTETQAREKTRQTLINDLERMRKSYTISGKLEEARLRRDPLFAEKLEQLAEVEYELNPDAPKPKVIYGALKTGAFLWKKETLSPTGEIERQTRPGTGSGEGRTIPDRASPSTSTTGRVDQMINQF
jgi:hypothetical protein